MVVSPDVNSRCTGKVCLQVHKTGPQASSLHPKSTFHVCLPSSSLVLPRAMEPGKKNSEVGLPNESFSIFVNVKVCRGTISGVFLGGFR